MYQEFEAEEEEKKEMEAEESKKNDENEMTEEEKAQKAKRDQEIAETIKEFDMENYDDEEDIAIDMKPYYEDNAEDPNIDQDVLFSFFLLFVCLFCLLIVFVLLLY